MHAMHGIYVLFLCLFGACTITSQGLTPNYCLRPVHHAIANRQQAILAARSAWYCIHPYERQATEQGWLNGFVASRKGDRWVVITQLPEGYVGPMIEMKLAAGDGRVLDVQFSQ